MKKLFALLTLFSTTLLADPIEELDHFIEQARKDWKVPGASVVVVQDGKVILAKGYGITEAGGTEWVDENTIFQLASVTKAFTAAALGVQVDRGKIGWDEKVIRHLPGFALSEQYPTENATPRDLLAHRTGLPAFGGDLLGKLGYSSDEILERVRLIPPATSFRNRAAYSNLGYFIAGEVLAAVKKTTWDQAVLSTLLIPLQMRRSGFSDNLDEVNVARGHVLKDGKAEVIDRDSTGGFPAAGAMTSTAKDMGAFMTMLVNKGTYEGKQILSEDTINELFVSTIPAEISFSEAAPIDENSGFNYGLGWDNYHYQGNRIVEKGGALDGVRSVVTLVPEKDIGITVLANVNLTLLPEAIRAKFLELYIGESQEDVQAVIVKQGREVTKIIEAPKQPQQVIPPSHKPADYTGTYENPLYGSFIIKHSKEGLVVHAGPDELKGTLKHFTGDTFILDWPVINTGNEKVTFNFGPNAQAKQFEAETLGNFTRI